MTNLILKAKTRTLLGKKIESLRDQNKIPAIIYGHGTKSQPLEVDYLAFQKVYEKAGESTLIDLQMDKKNPIKVLIQDVQFDPINDKYLHIDFYQVKMTEKITAEVPLKFRGESLAVIEKGGVLVKNLDHVKIECLPHYLIHEIEVDISGLKDFDSIIHVQDLKIPEEIAVLNKPEETVALVEPPRTEEELKELEKKEEEVSEEVPEKEEEAPKKEEGESTKEDSAKKDQEE